MAKKFLSTAIILSIFIFSIISVANAETIDDYTEIIKNNPNDVVAYQSRGIAYAKQKNFQQAVLDFSEAIKLSPNESRLYYNRALAYYYLKNYSQAISDCNKAIQLNSNYGAAYTNRGNCYFRLKNYNAAISDYTKALELNPNNADASKNLKILKQKFSSNTAVSEQNKSNYKNSIKVTDSSKNPHIETDALQIPGVYLIPPESEIPKIVYQFQNYEHWGILDNGASTASSLWYNFNSKGEKDILIAVEHIRTYQTFNAHNWYYFKVTYINQHKTNPAMLSKKYLPKVIYRSQDGQEKTAKITNVAFLNEIGIVSKISSSTLKEAFESKNVQIEVYRKNGETERIIIPPETVKQWKTVIEMDLKKVNEENK